MPSQANPAIPFVAVRLPSTTADHELSATSYSPVCNELNRNTPFDKDNYALPSSSNSVLTWPAKMGVPFEALIPYGIIIGVSFANCLYQPSEHG